MAARGFLGVCDEELFNNWLPVLKTTPEVLTSSFLLQIDAGCVINFSLISGRHRCLLGISLVFPYKPPGNAINNTEISFSRVKDLIVINSILIMLRHSNWRVARINSSIYNFKIMLKSGYDNITIDTIYTVNRIILLNILSIIFLNIFNLIPVGSLDFLLLDDWGKEDINFQLHL